MTELAGRRAVGGSATLVPVAALLVAMLSFQLGAVFAKGLFPAVGAEGAVALRTGLSALLLAAVARPWRARPSRRSAPALLLYGAALGCMNLLFYLSLRTIPLGIAMTLEFVGPLGLAMLASRRAVDFAWIGLAVAGLALLLPIGHSGQRIDPAGLALALGAGGCWAFYILFGQRAGAAHGAHATALGAAVAAAITLPIGIAHAGAALLSPPVLLAGLVVAVLSSAFPYSLEMIALTRLPTHSYGTLMSAEPAVGALVGLVFLHETLGPRQWLAIAAVMLASAGAAIGARAGAPAPPG